MGNAGHAAAEHHWRCVIQEKANDADMRRELIGGEGNVSKVFARLRPLRCLDVGQKGRHPPRNPLVPRRAIVLVDRAPETEVVFVRTHRFLNRDEHRKQLIEILLQGREDLAEIACATDQD